ncbi:MAG: hypothetical protein ACREQ4_14690 [Candidatus Binataceae bacterium]
MVLAFDPHLQIADGAAAILAMSAPWARELGWRPMARVVDGCLVACDPVLMLEGPIPATQKLLARNCLRIEDIDVFEINEAFAAVVLAWAKTLRPEPIRVNPNGAANDARDGAEIDVVATHETLPLAAHLPHLVGFAGEGGVGIHRAVSFSLFEDLFLDSHQLVFLVDQRGRMISIRGGSEAMDAAAAIGASPGGGWSEQDVGCSVIGTSLYTGCRSNSAGKKTTSPISTGGRVRPHRFTIRLTVPSSATSASAATSD